MKFNRRHSIYGRKTWFEGVEYKSIYEASIAEAAHNAGYLSNIKYEDVRVQYIRTYKESYTPDFVIDTKSGKKIYVEAKKFIDVLGKKKLTYILKNKILDLRFVFSDPHLKMKGCKKETYASWAERLGAKWSEGTIPQEWINE